MYEYENKYEIRELLFQVTSRTSPQNLLLVLRFTASFKVKSNEKASKNSSSKARTTALNHLLEKLLILRLSTFQQVETRSRPIWFHWSTRPSRNKDLFRVVIKFLRIFHLVSVSCVAFSQKMPPSEPPQLWLLLCLTTRKILFDSNFFPRFPIKQVEFIYIRNDKIVKLSNLFYLGNPDEGKGERSASKRVFSGLFWNFGQDFFGSPYQPG